MVRESWFWPLAKLALSVSCAVLPAGAARPPYSTRPRNRTPSARAQGRSGAIERSAARVCHPAARVLLSLAGSHWRCRRPLVGRANGIYLLGHHRRGHVPAAASSGLTAAAEATSDGGVACCVWRRSGRQTLLLHPWHTRFCCCSAWSCVESCAPDRVRGAQRGSGAARDRASIVSAGTVLAVPWARRGKLGGVRI